MHHALSRAERSVAIRLRSFATLIQLTLVASVVLAQEVEPTTPTVGDAPQSELATDTSAQGPALATSLSSVPAAVLPTAPPSPPTPKKSDESPWKFAYHGYLRAPLRFGIGTRRDSDLPAGYDVSDTRTTIHEATVPDDQYLSFQSTGHNPRSWAEGFFSFGNSFATGTLGIGSYNLTEAGFNDYEANWGVSQAYVTLTPDLPWENVRLWGKAGAIVDR